MTCVKKWEITILQLNEVHQPFTHEANNNYQGLKFALWFFYLYLALVAFRSFTHMFAQDAGLNSIASIIIFPEVNNLNPNSVIYL